MRAELHVVPPAGTPLRCALMGGVEGHSGIYLGRRTVAELHGDGYLQRVSLSGFLNGTDGPNPRSGLRIYAACDAASGRPLASPDVAARTRRLVPAGGKKKPLHYEVLHYNCHRFAAGCVCGRFGWGGNTVFTSDSLRQVISQCLNHGRPVVWRPVNASVPGFEYSPTPGKIACKMAVQIAKTGAFGAGEDLLELALGIALGKSAFPIARGMDLFGAPALLQGGGQA